MSEKNGTINGIPCMIKLSFSQDYGIGGKPGLRYWRGFAFFEDEESILHILQSCHENDYVTVESHGYTGSAVIDNCSGENKTLLFEGSGALERKVIGRENDAY